jgi:hypothetical protein
MRFHYEPPNTEISTGNSSSIQLTIDNSYKFIGVWEEVLDFTTIQLLIHSNINSDTNGILLEFSQNKIDIDYKLTDNYIANYGYVKLFPIISRYFRLTYTSLSSNTTEFRLLTLKTNIPTNAMGDSNDKLDYQTNKDAFGRLRVSNVKTLFESTNISKKDLYLMDEKLIGGSTATHNFSNSCINMSVFSNNDKVIRQSHRYLKYQPGKSLLIYSTGVLNSRDTGNESNTTSRIGYFDDENGVFFQYNNSNISLGLRSNTTGTITDTIINSSNWNIDTMNGSGPSGFIFDSTKTQIFTFDIEWLGVGSVRYGLVLDGILHYVHKKNHANILNNIYMTSANLPIRYEISASGTSNTQGSMKEICNTVLSEGGYEPLGITMSISQDTTKNITSGEEPLIVLRLKNEFKRNYIDIHSIKALNTSKKDECLYKLRIYRHVENLGNLFTIPPIYSDINTYSYLEANINVSSFSNINAYNSIIHLNGFATEGMGTEANHSKAITLTSNIDGIQDIAVLTMSNIGGNTSGIGSITWVEYH